MIRENAQVKQHKAESTNAASGDGLSRSSVDRHRNMKGAKGLGHLVKQILTILKKRGLK
jgi:hypothetical protein